MIQRILKELSFSKEFKNKLSHNFHEFTFLEKIIYCLFFRMFKKKEERFFFEGHWLIPGQLYSSDRQALYDTIIKYHHRHCFEVGTYTGGGSTYFLAQAFKKLGQGKVITSEIDDYYFTKAKRGYKKHAPDLLPYIEFVHSAKSEDFEPFLKNQGSIDCLFLDGPEDALQTKKQYDFFSKYFKKGTIIMLHDWNTEKMKLIKSILKNSDEWLPLLEINPPQSLGFVAFQKK